MSVVRKISQTKVFVTRKKQNELMLVSDCVVFGVKNQGSLKNEEASRLKVH